MGGAASFPVAAPEGSDPVQITTRFEPSTSEYSRETADKLKEARSLVTAQIWTEEEFQADKKALLSGGVSALDDDKFEAPDEIQQGISVVAHGFRLNSAMVVPVGPHCSSEKIFDVSKLRGYAATNFHKEPRAEITKIEESSLDDFASTLEASVTVSGEAGFGGGSVSGSLSAELSLSSRSKQSSHYIQHRKSYVFGHVTLPGTALGAKRIQGLMDEDTLAAFQAVDNDKKAEEIVDAFGPFFISSANFGCLATYTKVVKAKSGESAMSAGLALEVEANSAWASGKVEGSVDRTSDQSSEDSEGKVVIRKLGGEPLTAETESDWLATAATAPVIIKYSLKALDQLLDEGTPAAKLLKHACNKVRDVKMKELEELSDMYDIEVMETLPPGRYEFWRKERGEDRYMRANADGVSLQWGDGRAIIGGPSGTDPPLQHKKKGSGGADSMFQFDIGTVTSMVVTIHSAYAQTEQDIGLVGIMDMSPKNSSAIILLQKKLVNELKQWSMSESMFQWKVTKHDSKNQTVAFKNVKAGLFLNSHDNFGCHLWRHEEIWHYKKVDS